MIKRNKKGFTLAELLIVVAIIAVLVAISIPVFSKQSEKAKEAVDIANMRNAYAEYSVALIGDDTIDGNKASVYSETTPLYYDGSKLTKVKPSSPIGRGTTVNGDTHYSACNDYQYDPTVDYTSFYIIVYSVNDKVHVHFTDGSGSGGDSGSGDTDTTIQIADKTFNYTKLENDKVSLIAGNVYKYNDSYYIATQSDKEYDAQWTIPGTSGNDYLYVKLTGTVLVSNDGSTLNNVNYGDVYSNGTDVYVCIIQSGSTHESIPTSSSSKWLKIN